jgi:hypothetical protein
MMSALAYTSALPRARAVQAAADVNVRTHARRTHTQAMLKGDSLALRVKSSSLRSKGFLLRRATCAASSDADAPLERTDGAPMSATEDVLQLLNGTPLVGQSPSPVPPRPILINDKPLDVLATEAAALYPALKDVRVNPAIVPGAPLYERFAAAVDAAGDERRIELLLHGTYEHNIDSILASGLRGSLYCNTRWLTSCPRVASHYTRRAKRIVIFAVLNPKPCSSYPGKAYTVTVDSHHLPLFVARR